MFRKTVFIFIIIFNLIICIGCNQNELLMEAPKLPDDQQEIRELLKHLLKPDARLTAVNNGTNKNAIQFIDLDQDGHEEAIVNYILENDSAPLRCLILKKGSKGWETVGEAKGIGYSIDRIDYQDITGDGQKEIIIGWQLGDLMTKGVSVYRLYDDNLEEVFVDYYEEMVVGDLDLDKLKELVLIKRDRENLEAKAQLFKYRDNQIRLVDEVEMDGTVNGYFNIVMGFAKHNQKGIFIDSGLGAHSAQTELIVIQEGKLKNIFFDPQKGVDNKLFKPYSTVSIDIDNDGIVEISNLREPVGYEDAAMAAIPWIETWYKWDGKDDLVPCLESYSNYIMGLRFYFPDKWDERITINTVYKDQKDGSIIFSYLSEDNRKYSLFTIETFNLDKWEQLEKSDIDQVEISRNLNRIYAVHIDSRASHQKAGEMHLDIDEIKENFKIISD